MSVYQFTVDDLRERYGCKSDTELAELLGCSKGTISVWRSNGVPTGYQRFLNVETHTPLSRKKLPLTA
ncbi:MULTISPECIES: helix-turn-helix domain-containing protein [unclassified Acinetobacter]|uniref:helix-turn-helix domain-containing protein n=1 Tax=unclassified Acinetobacter TaxID=196816 RepID=UPI0015D2374A|nr:MULTISPECIES: helix-turn-helix domain-containing protein [unclassified Acinetobacter]